LRKRHPIEKQMQHWVDDFQESCLLNLGTHADNPSAIIFLTMGVSFMMQGGLGNLCSRLFDFAEVEALSEQHDYGKQSERQIA
jgi:hypothetical protein